MQAATGTTNFQRPEDKQGRLNTETPPDHFVILIPSILDAHPAIQIVTPLEVSSGSFEKSDLGMTREQSLSHRRSVLVLMNKIFENSIFAGFILVTPHPLIPFGILTSNQ
jgi:hypothetical protein